MVFFIWLTAALFLFVILWAIIIYNRLISMKNNVEGAWSQIDVQLKRRYDLIPNLVAAVKGYMEHEKSVLDKVINARLSAMKADRINDRAAAEDMVSGALKGLFAVMEQYPSLRASENVMQLQEELVTTENRIAFARQFYNDLVANYTAQRDVFPDSIISSMFSFRSYEYFRASEADRQMPGIIE